MGITMGIIFARNESQKGREWRGSWADRMVREALLGRGGGTPPAGGLYIAWRCGAAVGSGIAGTARGGAVFCARPGRTYT